MHRKEAIGGIGLMLLGIGLPAFFQITWGWGGVLCFFGLVLLIVACRDWLFGRSPNTLDLAGLAGRAMPPAPLKSNTKGLDAFDPPEVWLSISLNPTTAFLVENRHTFKDASFVSMDTVNTANFRLESKLMPRLDRGQKKTLIVTMVRRLPDEEYYLDPDLPKILQDVFGDNFGGSIQVMLRFKDVLGEEYTRNVTVESDRLRLIDQSVTVLNHEIKRQER